MTGGQLRAGRIRRLEYLEPARVIRPDVISAVLSYRGITVGR
jgi:hypothetical protein